MTCSPISGGGQGFSFPSPNPRCALSVAGTRPRTFRAPGKGLTSNKSHEENPMHLGDTHRSQYGLENHGLATTGDVYWTLPTAVLYEQALARDEGMLSSHGPLVVRTGQHTGRSANDKFVVRDENTADELWWGKVNVPYEP